MLLFVISKKIINAEKEQKIKKFLLKQIFLYLKIIITLNIKNIEFNKGLREEKKFKNNAKKEITINPKISCKEKVIKLLPLQKKIPKGVYNAVTKKLDNIILII